MKTIALPNRYEAESQPAAKSLPIGALLPGSSNLALADLAADRLVLPDQLPTVTNRRLVVLLPVGEINELALAKRVWQLASACQLDVLYLALTPDSEQANYQRRRLVSLAALSSDWRVRTSIQVCRDRNWMQALKPALQPGDLLVCLAADQARGFLRFQSLAERLAAGLDVPVYELGGLQVSQAPLSQPWLRNTFGWVASLVMMATFYWLQVGIDRAASQPQTDILLTLSVLAELYGLWKINLKIG